MSAVAVRKIREKLDRKFRGEREGLWRFWDHGVTQSLMAKFMTCREQCRLEYVEGWQTRRVGDALMFGNIAHHCLDWLYRGISEVEHERGARIGKLRRAFVAGVADKVREATCDFEESWRREVGRPTAAQEEQMQRLLGLAEVLLARYAARWCGDFTGHYPEGAPRIQPAKWLAPEHEFRVPFKFDDGRRTWVRGKFDGRFVSARGKLWLRENKFKAQVDDAALVDLLQNDLQCMTYLWAQWRETGEPPAGVVFDVTRRPGQRFLKDDTLDTYLARVKKDVNSPGRAAHYFHRYEVQVTRHELAAWERATLRPIMEDVRAWWEGKSPHYANPGALEGKYGKAFMWGPIVRGDFSECYRKAKPFSELMGEL